MKANHFTLNFIVILIRRRVVGRRLLLNMTAGVDAAKMNQIFKFLVNHARDQKRTKGMLFPMKRELIDDLIDAAIITFMNDPILLEVSPPVTLFGDLHGQIDDLVGWFDWIGWPPKLRMLCLGLLNFVPVFIA